MTAPHPKIAAIVLLRDDGAALMQLRDDKPGLPRANTWVIPGGHVDPDEDNLTAARRELLEETAYDCDNLKYLETFADRNDVTGQSYELVVFWGRYDAKQELRCLEGQALRFMNREEAERLKVPQVIIEAWDKALASVEA